MSQVDDLVESLLDSPIAFHRCFVDITGSVLAALMLSQAWYWSKAKRNKEPNGWFYKTREEWKEETGLSRSEQECARKVLRKTDFWIEELRGVPAQLWYRVDKKKLQTSLLNPASQLAGSCQQEGENLPTFTSSETTTETNSETTTSFELLDEDLTPKKNPPPKEVFDLASRVFRQVTKLKFGTLWEKHEGRWKALLEEYGQEAVLGAVGLWARELDKEWARKQTTKMNWIAVFLKEADNHIQAFKDYQAPEPGDERKPEADDEVTIDDIRRERGQDRRGKKG